MSLPSDEFVRRAELIKIVDGDTLRLKIDLGFGASMTHDIRLLGCDTPESRGPESAAGKFVTTQVGKFIGATRDVLIHSKEFSLGKYGRCICEVWIAGRNLNRWLLASGFAWRTNSSGQLEDVRDVENLAGIPDAVKQQVREAMA